MAVSLFTVLPIELYKFCISLQLTLTKDMASLIGGKSIGVSAEQSLTAISSLKVGTGLLIFLLIMMGYSIIKVFFANLKRGGILLITVVVGSLYMFSIVRGYTDGFIQWCKQVVGICLTAFLQSVILIAGLGVMRENVIRNWDHFSSERDTKDHWTVWTGYEYESQSDVNNLCCTIRSHNYQNNCRSYEIMEWNQRYMAVIQPEGIGVIISEDEFSTFIAHFGEFGNIEIYDCLTHEIIIRTKGVHIQCFYPDIHDRSLAGLKAKRYYSYFENYKYQLKRKYPKGRLKSLYQSLKVYFVQE